MLQVSADITDGRSRSSVSPGAFELYQSTDLSLKLTKPKKGEKGCKQHGSWGQKVFFVTYPGVKLTSFLAFIKQGTGSESWSKSELIFLFSDRGFVLTHWYMQNGQCNKESRASDQRWGRLGYSNSDLDGFQLLWDYMLRVWVPVLNFSVKPHFLTVLLVTLKKHQKFTNTSWAFIVASWLTSLC